MGIFLSILKIVLLYFIIVILYRFMGKRKINELSIMDLIVVVFLSNMITNNILEVNQSLLYLIITVISVIVLQMIMTYIAPKIPYVKYMFEGAKATIISKGKLNFKEMLNRQYNLNDLLKELKIRSIKRIEDVEYAFLENDGKLKTFGYGKNNNDGPLPIILDGNIQYVTLRLLNKDDIWLNTILDKENVYIENIFYAFYKNGKLYIIKNT